MGGASRGVSRKVRDCRIGSSHGVSRRVTGFSFYHGLSDFFFFSSHGVSRKVTNYRIIEFSSHGESRKVTELFFFITNYRIIELILSITRNVAEDHGFFFTLNVGSAEVWVTRRGGVGACFLYVTVKIMCISWVSQTSIRR